MKVITSMTIYPVDALAGDKPIKSSMFLYSGRVLHLNEFISKILLIVNRAVGFCSIFLI